MARLAVATLFAVVALTLPPGAVAAPPAVSVHASTLRGPVPLEVTLTAVGAATSYTWDLGDGATADGAVVRHVFPRTPSENCVGGLRLAGRAA